MTIDILLSQLVGVDLHFLILSNAEEIMKMIKNIAQRCELNNLEKIEDSVQLCLILFQLKKMTRVIPSRQMYPDPKAKEAQKPKQLQGAPADQ